MIIFSRLVNLLIVIFFAENRKPPSISADDDEYGNTATFANFDKLMNSFVEKFPILSLLNLPLMLAF